MTFYTYNCRSGSQHVMLTLEWQACGEIEGVNIDAAVVSGYISALDLTTNYMEDYKVYCTPATIVIEGYTVDTFYAMVSTRLFKYAHEMSDECLHVTRSGRCIDAFQLITRVNSRALVLEGSSDEAGLGDMLDVL